MRPSLILLAGPNGAGKSTLYETRVAPSFAGPFINADLIQRDELKDPSMEASYRAAEIATERRTCMLEDRKSFATETVFSHASKLSVITEAQAVLQADRGMVFDNSKLNEPPRLMLLFAAGRLVQAEPVLPGWVLTGYADDLVI